MKKEKEKGKKKQCGKFSCKNAKQARFMKQTFCFSLIRYICQWICIAWAHRYIPWFRHNKDGETPQYNIHEK